MSDNPKVFEITIYLKSGAVLTFDSTKLNTKRNGANELTSIEWLTPPDTPERKYRQLAYIRIDDISAIVAE